MDSCLQRVSIVDSSCWCRRRPLGHHETVWRQHPRSCLWQLPVCEFYGYNVKERWSSKERGRVCAFRVDGDPISVQSHPWAWFTRVSSILFIWALWADYINLFPFVSKFGRRRTGNCPNRFALPPPTYAAQSMRNSPRTSRSTSFQTRTPQAYDSGVAAATAPVPNARNDGQLCPICLVIPKNMAFNCGHQVTCSVYNYLKDYISNKKKLTLIFFITQTCSDCGEDLHVCPICRSSISVRIKLY